MLEATTNPARRLQAHGTLIRIDGKTLVLKRRIARNSQDPLTIPTHDKTTLLVDGDAPSGVSCGLV